MGSERREGGWREEKEERKKRQGNKGKRRQQLLEFLRLRTSQIVNLSLFNLKTECAFEAKM